MPIITPKQAAVGRDHNRHDAKGLVAPRRRFPGRPVSPHRRRRFLLRGGALLLLTGTVTVVAMAAWVSQDLPDPNKINSRLVAQSTKIYARDGSTLLYEVHGDQRRTVVELNDISPYVKQAALSIEDKDFYKHRGVSLRGLLRAIFIDILSGRKAQGGSTITQQLVKNSILTREKSFIRKAKEIILSYQIEQRFSKDQILKLYFNEIPYGSSNYGVEAAAQAYFGKHAKDLDLAESALLAALVKAPTYYAPNGIHRQELVARQQLVLSEMVKDGAVTQAQADEARAVDILKRISPYRDRIVAPHFVFTVRDQLVQKYGDALIERGGLRVVTTLDSKLQQIAEEEVTAGAAKNEKKYRAGNAALVAIDPRTGQVLAMVGSRDFFDTEHDGNFNVATAVRNPGSSFKPVVYLTAFTKGYSPNTLLFDLKTNFGPDGSGKAFVPNNYDLKEHGPLKMRQTLAGSLNIPAVKTLYLAGIPSVLDLAERLGYTTIDRDKVGLALAIGGGGIKLVEHVGAFAVLANGGVRNPVATLLRVEDRSGKILEQFTPQPSRAANADAVNQVTDVMTDNGARAFIFGAKNLLTLGSRPVAAKTGTTNDNRDGWTLGFTPSLASGVWVGNNDYSPMRAGSDGVVVAAPIWRNFMERALKDKPAERFSKPKPSTATKPVLLGKLPGDVPIAVDAETGKQIPDSCLAAWPKQFVAQRAVKEVHTILYYVNKDNPGGPAPASPTKDPMFARWEKPVQDWAKKNGYVAQNPGLESCALRSGGTGPAVAFTAPVPNSTVSGTSLVTSVEVVSSSAVATVQFFLDGTVVATATTPPYTATVDLAAAVSGYHTLRVVVNDVVGGTASAETRFNLLAGNVPTVYFVAPTPRENVPASSFPRAVRVIAIDPDGVAAVTLLTKNTDGTTTVLASVDNPADQAVNLSWPTTAPGPYQLFVTMKNRRGLVTTSDALTVAVVTAGA